MMSDNLHIMACCPQLESIAIPLALMTRVWATESCTVSTVMCRDLMEMLVRLAITYLLAELLVL